MALKKRRIYIDSSSGASEVDRPEWILGCCSRRRSFQSQVIFSLTVTSAQVVETRSHERGEDLTKQEYAPLTWTALTDKLISLSIFIIATFLLFLTFRKSLTSSSFFEKSKWARWDTCGIRRWWCSKFVIPRFTSAATDLVWTSRALGNGSAFFRRQQQKNKFSPDRERERYYKSVIQFKIIKEGCIKTVEASL